MNTKVLFVSILLVGVALIGAYYLGLFSSKETLPQAQNTTVDTISQIDDWQEQNIDEISLSFQMPSDAMFRKEVSEGEVVRKLVFYVQKGSDDNPDYMLYGLYQFQPERQATVEVDIERWKAEMNPDTIKETTIGQYLGVEGLIQGKEQQYISGRTRYVKVVLKDGGLFSVSTLPPTEVNKELTEKILATFDFQ